MLCNFYRAKRLQQPKNLYLKIEIWYISKIEKTSQTLSPQFFYIYTHKILPQISNLKTIMLVVDLFEDLYGICFFLNQQ